MTITVQREVWDKQQSHYDLRAQVAGPPVASERARGVAYPLKKFHNEIKRCLIARFSGPRLLDLACGRGGDLQKWRDAKVEYAKGIDISASEIEEARGRYHNLPGGSKRPLVAEFEVSSTLGTVPNQIDRSGPYDLVTCMFAAHYFYISERSFETFISNVASNLKPGGYFVGTVPDGKRVLALLGGSSEFHSDVLTICRKFTGAPTTFGCEYTFAIVDTVTDNLAQTQGSQEYLVFFTAFTQIAAKFGLRPVLDWRLSPNQGLYFDSRDKYAAFKHFVPPPSIPSSLAQISSLYAAFVFQKIA